MINMTTKSGFKTLDIVYIGMFVALITICAYISIPTTVPFTMQTFGIFAAVSFLGQKRGTLAMLIYLLLGAIGAPVFTGFKGGFAVLFGPTGGYLLGYLLATILSGFLIKHLGRKFIVMFCAMVLGLLVCYTFGTVWFIYLYTKNGSNIGILGALSSCVFPFVIPDLIKISLAIILGKQLKPLLPNDIA
ncbi:MAG: biotin transporter BioY [Lachnospiraceae bacterium]|nr:biotin transporter BioY [Lachnospiraceae bacterium]